MKKFFVLMMLLGAVYASAQAQWEYFENIDPITDAVIKAVFIDTYDATSRTTRSFGVRRRNDDVVILVFWNEYMLLGDTHTLTYRFDKESAKTLTADLSTTREISMFWSAEFLAESLGKDKLVVRVTDTRGVSYTATFTITGLAEQLNKLL